MYSNLILDLGEFVTVIADKFDISEVEFEYNFLFLHLQIRKWKI